MLDLKSKLLEAGLVNDEDVKRVDEQNAKAKAKRRAQRQRKDAFKKKKKVQSDKKKEARRYDRKFAIDKKRWADRLLVLSKAEKSLQYDVIRTWVKEARLDPVRPTFDEELERFAFQKVDGAISFLSVPRAVEGQLRIGEAGLVAFMSHHGLTHAVVPRSVALDIHSLFPLWLRGLNAFEYELLFEEKQEDSGVPKVDVPEALQDAIDRKKESEEQETLRTEPSEVSGNDAGGAMEYDKSEKRIVVRKNDE